MREILFRGKRIDNDEWVEGWYEPPVEWDGHKFGTTICYICKKGYLKDAEVNPSTVGQYTGLTDKNGKRIFEGDILESHYDDLYPDNVTIEVVEWFRNGWYSRQPGDHDPDFLEEEGALPYSEIIGNIHDKGNSCSGRCRKRNSQ